MKSSITQIILGILIVFAACWVTGWMIYRAPQQLSQPVPDEEGRIVDYIDVLPQNNTQFSIARYGSYLLPVFGVFLIIGGAIQAARGSTSKRILAVSNIIAGVLTAGLALVIVTWGYPTTFHTGPPELTGSTMIIFTNPGRSQVAIESVSAALLPAGLAVAGIAVVQLIKSIKSTNI
jgi:hypothetical protein